MPADGGTCGTGRDGSLISPNDQQLGEPASGTAAAVGAALKARRNQTGRSLEAMAQRVELSTSTLSRYERGQCLPSEKHLNTICDALGISAPERLELLRALTQAKANSSRVRPAQPPTHRHRFRVLLEALRHRPLGGRLTAALLLISVAAGVSYLIIGRQSDSNSNQLSHNTAGCDRYTVGSTHLALRDFYSHPTIQLPHGDTITVIQYSHPRGLPYWEVTTKTNQEGWVDSRYLRPACG
jgi:transcriptional regulator with XRE-family HTH domain